MKIAFLLFSLSALASAADAPHALFDGQTLVGWRASADSKAWSVVDGAIRANGSCSHLFYQGDAKPYKNFELTLDVKSEPGANGGIYFHTAFQPNGWPSHGIEVQVNNTFPGADFRRTGSLLGLKDLLQSPAPDDRWFHVAISVRDRHATVKIDGKIVADYEQPAEGNDKTPVVGEGTFALQAHDPKSVVYYRNIEVKRLP